MMKGSLFRSLLPTLILVGVLSLSLDSAAQHVNYEPGYNHDRIVVRQTIPDPQAVKRRPLTSDRLSTTSTRLIDARRGFRPYSSVFCDRTSRHRYAAYDDHFGISRPENRPWSYSQRTPRSFVAQFRNNHVETPRADRTRPVMAPVIRVIVDERLHEEKPKPKAETKIRIHKDTSATPTTSGAVLITADGTVIQIGD